MEIVSRNHGMMKDRGLDRLRRSAVFQSIRSSFNLNDNDTIALTIMRKLSNILPDNPMPSCLAVKDFPLSEAAGYLEMDSRIVSVIRHAVSVRTPMMLRIKTKLGLNDLYIIRKQLAEYGIPAFMLDGPGCSSDEEDPIAGVLYAYHHKGIMLVPSSFRGFSEIMIKGIGEKAFSRMGRIPA